MKIVKSVCHKCGAVKQYTKKELIYQNVKQVSLSIFVTLGIVFTIYLFVVGVENPVNDIMNSQYERLSKNVDEELRLITIDITKDCDGDNSYCYAKAVYENVSGVRYIPSSSYNLFGMYDPLYVYELGGDCKNTANMYVSMLKSVGIKARVSCSANYKHCISVIPHFNYGEFQDVKFVVDLTQPHVVYINNGEDEWDFFKSVDRDLGW